MATIALLSACVCVLCAIMLCASVHAIYLGVAVKSPHLGTEARVIAIQGVLGVVSSIVALSFLYYLGGT